MKVKVCGLNNPVNISKIAKSGADLLGFIFYKKSPRYCNKALENEILHSLSGEIKKVGVFVNENEYKIADAGAKYFIDYVQLHGEESTKLCKQLQRDFKVIKTFSIGNRVNTEELKRYQGVCDYFLFDTKNKLRGGSGKKFDWQALAEYQLDTPFFLSGGIEYDDAKEIKSIKHSQLIGVDINSKFEIIPGTKDVELVKEFINEIKH